MLDDHEAGSHLLAQPADDGRECLDLAEGDQVALYEDLAAARQTVGDCLELYSVAVEAHEMAPTQATLNAKLAAGQLLRDAQAEMMPIVQAVERQQASKAERTGISVAALAYVARQLAGVAAEVYGDDMEAARLFERRARAIRLPGTAAELAGTALTPDMDVRAMDETVPLADEEAA